MVSCVPAVVALTQALALALTLPVLSGGSKYIYIYTYRQDQQQTCLRVTLTHILFINIAQKQLIFGNIPISNVWMLVVCIGSVRTTTKAIGRPADCSNSSHKMLLPTPPQSSLPAPALQVLRPSTRLLRYVQPESTETAAAAAAAQPNRAIAKAAAVASSKR